MPILDATRIPAGKSMTLQLDDGLNEKGEVNEKGIKDAI